MRATGRAALSRQQTIPATSETAPAAGPRDGACVARALWRHFAREGVAYCVVGAGVAEASKAGGDIDIVVGDREGAALIGLMRRFCHEDGLRLVQVLQHEWSAWYFILAWVDDAGGPRFLHIDICTDYVRDGRTVLTAGEILADRRDALGPEGEPLGYPLPAPASEFVYYLVKKIAKGAIEARHGDHLSAVWSADAPAARDRLARFWSARDADLIADAAETSDWDAVRAALPRLQDALHARLTWAPGARRRETLRRLRRVARPSGLTIALLGPDGSGKTSLIERLVPALEPAFRRTRRFHLRPRLGGGNAARAPVDDPHGAPPRGAAASIAKLAFFLADYWAGYLLRLWPLKVRSTLIVFDRYYHDLLADPRRYRYGGPRWLASAVARLVPKPDLWLVLDAPAEVLQARKAEVAADESARQRTAYRDLAARLGNAVMIDATRPPDHAAGVAARAVIDHLALRLARRLGPGTR